MANRSVVVELKLQSDQYKTEIEAAKLKTEELDHKVEALDKDVNSLGRDSVKAAAEVGVLGEAAKQTGADVEDMGNKTETTTDKTVRARDELGRFKKTTDEAAVGVEDLGKKTEDFGKKADNGGANIKTLRTRIDELETSLKATGTAFAANASPELLKKFKADSSELSGLKSAVQQMEKLGVDVEQLGLKAEQAAGSVGDLFSGGLTSPAGIAGITALAVPALAAVGGLVTALAGVGVAGAGIAGAIAGNPQAFKSEWADAIGTIKNDWIAASAPFVGPTLTAIRSIGPLFDSWHIDQTFAKAAAYVEPLVRGVEGFATGIEQGVAALVDKAGPAIAVFSADLPKIGDSVGTALKMIGSQAEGGAQSLHDFVVALDETIVAVGATVAGAEALGGALTQANASVKHFFDGLSTWVYILDPLLLIPKELADAFTPEPFDASAGAIGRLGSTLGDLGRIGGQALTTIQDDAAGAAAMLDRMNQSFDKSLSDALGLSRADIQVAQGFADLTKQFEKGSNALDINTQRGRDNVTTIDKIVAGLQQQRDKSIAAAGGTQAATDAANKAYDSQLAHLGQMLVSLGNNKAAVDGLLNSFRDKTFTITQKVTTIYDHIGSVSQQGVVSGGVPRTPGAAYAEGGDPAPGWALVGERGPEIVNFRGDEHVYTAAQTRSMMASSTPSWTGGSGSTAVQVSLAVAPGGNLTALGTLFNGMIRDGLIVVKASQVRPA